MKINFDVIKSTKFAYLNLTVSWTAIKTRGLRRRPTTVTTWTVSWATRRRRRRRGWAPVRAARWWPPTRSRRRSCRRGRATNVKLSAAQHPPRGCGRWTERRSSGRQRRGGTLVGTWWDLHYLYFEGTWWWDLMVGLVWDLMVGLLSIWAWNEARLDLVNKLRNRSTQIYHRFCFTHPDRHWLLVSIIIIFSLWAGNWCMWNARPVAVSLDQRLPFCLFRLTRKTVAESPDLSSGTTPVKGGAS